MGPLLHFGIFNLSTSKYYLLLATSLDMLECVICVIPWIAIQNNLFKSWLRVSILAVSRICVSLRYGWDCVMSGRLVIFFYFSIGYYWDITREVAKGTNRVWWPRDLPKNTKSRFALVVPWDICYIMGFSTCQPPNKYCLLLSTSLNMTEDIIITFYDIMETSPGGSWRNVAIITATISSSIY